MHRSTWLRILLALAFVVTPLVTSLAFLPSMAFAAPAAPDASVDDEIILLESNGRIRVDDRDATGAQQEVWNSGSDIGWKVVAAGDFNGDGDAEIVATRYGMLRVFDPWPTGQVLYSYALSGRSAPLIVTADFDKDGLDEIAAVATDGSTDIVSVFDGGAAGATWTIAWEASFGTVWQDMGTGDFNNDGYDDLALVRNADRRIMVYKGGAAANLTTLVTQSDYGTDWLSVAGGNFSANYAGDELALARDSVAGQTNALILIRVSSSSTFVDIGGGVNYKYYPEFASLALGDLNGDGDDEIVILRDPVENKTSLLVVNPTGVSMRTFSRAIGYGSTAWRLVRVGDIDGDGRDEVVVLRSDRYRVYYEPELTDNYTDMLASFLTNSTTTNAPTMAVADVRGVDVPTLGVAPVSLTFDAESGQTSPTKTVQISNSGTSSVITWQATVTEGAAWLRIDKTSGVTPGSLGVSVDTSAVVPATYTGKIRITATTSGVSNTPVDVTVTLNLTGVTMSVSPASLSFNVAYGEISPQQIVSISSVGGSAAYGWVADILEGAAWLNLSASQGTSPYSLGVSVNATAAGLGTHLGTIRIRSLDSQVSGSPKYVEVNLTVPDPGFVILPSEVTIWQKFNASAVTKSVSIERPGGTANWNATAFPVASFAAATEEIAAGRAVVTSDGLLPDGVQATSLDWLVFTPNSGTTKSTMAISIKPGTAIGTYHAVIVVVASNANPAVPDPVRYIEVTGIVFDQFKSYLPLIKR